MLQRSCSTPDFLLRIFPYIIYQNRDISGRDSACHNAGFGELIFGNSVKMLLCSKMFLRLKDLRDLRLLTERPCSSFFHCEYFHGETSWGSFGLVFNM